MKKTIIIIAAVTISLFSCNNSTTTKNETPSTPTENVSNKTGEFTIDGKKITGEVTTQYFGSDKEKSNFSVLCQHNEGGNDNPNFELLQVTFINEKDATTAPLKIYSGSTLPMTEPESGSVTIALSGVGEGFNNEEFVGTDKPSGSIAVTDRKIIIKEVVLATRSGAKKTVSATIPF
ncbi:hypothetical protein ACFOWM_07255 [Ferruginibacter yonginensis]|uniref:Lipoprotein n=1 Tax=Ferruginibacter yonginensis TaxID=1310416 RepID=A0ABV8QSN0_9BACT